ncbi:hypothetical protein E2320_014041 [Naja naja]|nr:hypothetical protein E2320_014041 [Naja naja]
MQIGSLIRATCLRPILSAWRLSLFLQVALHSSLLLRKCKIRKCYLISFTRQGDTRKRPMKEGRRKRSLRKDEFLLQQRKMDLQPGY